MMALGSPHTESDAYLLKIHVVDHLLAAHGQATYVSLKNDSEYVCLSR